MRGLTKKAFGYPHTWTIDALTADKNTHITVDENPEVTCKSLKSLVDLGGVRTPDPMVANPVIASIESH